MKLEEALKFSGPRLLSKKLSEKNFSNVFSPFFLLKIDFLVATAISEEVFKFVILPLKTFIF